MDISKLDEIIERQSFELAKLKAFRQLLEAQLKGPDMPWPTPGLIATEADIGAILVLWANPKDVRISGLLLSWFRLEDPEDIESFYYPAGEIPSSHLISNVFPGEHEISLRYFIKGEPGEVVTVNAKAM